MRSRYFGALLAASALLAAGRAAAMSETLTGVLNTDDGMAVYNLTLNTASSLAVSTDSYGGGINLDGTTTAPGGFVPIVSLFAPNGAFIVDDGADVTAPGRIDPTTGIADDAAFVTGELGAGVYTLAVTEFYNFPNGPNLSDGFFAAGQGDFTGGICGTSGAFLQVDLVSCPQRTNAYTVNVVSTAVPEPASWALMFAGFALAGAGLRGKLRLRRAVRHIA